MVFEAQAADTSTVTPRESGRPDEREPKPFLSHSIVRCHVRTRRSPLRQC